MDNIRKTYTVHLTITVVYQLLWRHFVTPSSAVEVACESIKHCKTREGLPVILRGTACSMVYAGQLAKGISIHAAPTMVTYNLNQTPSHPTIPRYSKY